MYRVSSVVLTSVLVLLVACEDPVVSAGPDVDPSEQALDTPSAIEAPPEQDEAPTGFDGAAAITGVPVPLLIGISQSETGMQMIQGSIEFEGKSPRVGIMGINELHLAEAALLADVDLDDARLDRDANILAAASLLAAWADEADIDTGDLGAWAPVVARYSDIEHEEALAEYVHYQVFDIVNNGVELEGYSLKGTPTEPDWPVPSRDADRTGESGTIWTGSPNSSGRGSHDPEIVVIHTCEGSYSGCWGWLSNSRSGVSAHYVVNNTGSEVRQLVDEDRKAWHISADYSSSRNAGVLSNKNGVSTNNISVGIEHAGYSSQSSWNSGLIARSAALSCGITERHGIPIDSHHIVGHGQLQPWNRTDPGAAWPWASYLSQVENVCGGGTTTPPPNPNPNPNPNPSPNPNPNPAPTSGPTGSTFVIDSNNNANNTSWYRANVSSSWWASANVSGYYNTGYWVGPTGSISDAARFEFRSSGDACYAVQGWWTQGSDRPSDVAYIGWDSEDTEVGRAIVNQRINGGQWNNLGTWQFDQGWNTVLVSRWNGSGEYAIADAVRLIPSTCN